MNYNNDFRYDLQVGQLGEQELSEILHHKRIEVKKDLIAYKTGNVFIEYSSRNKPSGISTSQAEYYAFILKDSIVLKDISSLKQLCRQYLNTSRDVLGGDSNTSKGILLPIEKLIK